MIRIIYMSTANYLFPKDELEELLEKSINNNSKSNITGLLITKGKTFLQCLEGNKKDVRELYERIKKDDRHHGVLDLIEEKCDEKLFPDWSMGFKSIENLSVIESEEINEITKKDLKHLKNSEVYEIFEYFVK